MGLSKHFAIFKIILSAANLYRDLIALFVGRSFVYVIFQLNEELIVIPIIELTIVMLTY
jgi:hypothetical protein